MLDRSSSPTRRVALRAVTCTAVLVTLLAAACSSDSNSTTTPVATKPPAQLQINGGNSQTAPILANVPQVLVVEVLDSLGNPDPGVDVTFATSDTTAHIGAYDVVTDANGLAKTAFIMGTHAGTEVVTATVAGVAGVINFDLIATPEPAVSIGFASGGGQAGPAGSILSAPLVVQVQDQYGNGVPGASITWTTTAGELLTSDLVTDANGKATATLQLPATAGPVEVSVTLPSVAGATSTVLLTAQ